jgi:dTDP-4-dehydrorhamnose 3,5-epimerase
MFQPRLHKQGLTRDNRGYTLKFPEVSSPHSLGYSQILVSFNKEIGTFRGMHWQPETNKETKFIAVLHGRILDFQVDMNTDSPTFGVVNQIEISDDGSVLEIPPLFAHGYLTLSANTEILYGISGSYDTESQRGFRWNDSAFDIKLPFTPKVISDRDSQFEDFWLNS